VGLEEAAVELPYCSDDSDFFEIVTCLLAALSIGRSERDSHDFRRLFFRKGGGDF